MMELLGQLVSEATEAEIEMDFPRAATLYRAAREICPGDYRLAANQGHVYWCADQPALALACYQESVCLAPDDPVVYRGLGNAYLDLRLFEAAENAYAMSGELDDQALTAWNRSQVLIGLERYEEGYAMAERRWSLPGYSPYRGATGRWQGEPEGLAGSMVVWSEQGFGDTFQHLRWIGTLVALRGPGSPALVLEVEHCLVALIQEGFAHLEPAPKAVAKGNPALLGVEWHTSLLSLPHLLGAGPHPENACQLKIDNWPPPRPWPFQGAPRIGVVWAAGRKLDDPFQRREYLRRSLSASALRKLVKGLQLLGAHVVSLQFGSDQDQVAPWASALAEVLPAGADFATTAATVAGLDLVISVDTAMAHLVGAMGRRSWVLLPYSAAPRWLRERSDTPWYETLRLFRQREPGGWDGVVERVLIALEADFKV